MKELFNYFILTHLGRIILGVCGTLLFGFIYKFAEYDVFKYIMFTFCGLWVGECLIMIGYMIYNTLKS